MAIEEKHELLCSQCQTQVETEVLQFFQILLFGCAHIENFSYLFKLHTFFRVYFQYIFFICFGHKVHIRKLWNSIILNVALHNLYRNNHIVVGFIELNYNLLVLLIE